MTNKFKLAKLCSIVLLSVLGISCAQKNQEDTSSKEEWVPLFNGYNLEGWTPKIMGFPLGENFNNTFLVKDSLLSVSYGEYDTFGTYFGHLFYIEKFSHYKLKVQYRFTGEQVNQGPGWARRNNGLMLHSQSPESMGLYQDFPISLEFQLLGGLSSGERPTGNLCTPGTHVYFEDLFTPHCINSTSKTYHGDQWVNVEAVVLGDSIIHHIVESDTVMTYTRPVMGGSLEGLKPDVLQEGKSILEGYITIQAESHPTQFKSIELLNLCGCMDKKAKNYKSYYIKDDRSKCEY